MGNLISRLNSPLEDYAQRVHRLIASRKRRREDESEAADMSCVVERELNTPKRKKLVSTTQYIYQALFKEQRNSDVSVYALGKLWRLHKIYLCQSPYFASMFGGSWRETEDDFVNIEIIDPQVNLESLETVFGSLYQDEVTIDPKRVISVLATATQFQLDGLINQCAEVMTETVNAETAIPFFEAASAYGVQSVQKTTLDWLLVNLLSFYSRHPQWMRQIGVELMEKLVGHPDLFVIQTEFSVYLLLRHWLFLHLQPTAHTTNEQSVGGSSELPLPSRKPYKQLYFRELKDKTPFLKKMEGRKYERVFRQLRVQNLLQHPVDVNVILDDNIMPREWLNGPVLAQWTSMLNIDQNLEMGPQECDPEQFYSSCLRYGRVISDKLHQKWRWTGYNFGLDLVFITDTRTLYVKRHHRTEHERMLSLQTKRHIIMRVTLCSLNEQRQVRHTQTTNIVPLTLDKNQELPLMYLDSALEYPLLISLNLLLVSPGEIESASAALQAEADDATTASISNIGSKEGCSSD